MVVPMRRGLRGCIPARGLMGEFSPIKIELKKIYLIIV
jgi:hypothetical protein